MKAWRMTRAGAFRAGTIGRALFVSLSVLALLFLATAQAAKPNQPPSVSITSPASNATFVAGATISLSATASDSDGTVTKVEYFRGGSTLIGTASVPPFAVQWTNVAAGGYSLTARATDNLGATKVSSAINITVSQSTNPPPNIAPLVVLTAPQPCTIYDAPASIVLAADAIDPDGSIVLVEFLQGLDIIGSATTSPYLMTWTNVTEGTYTLTARATDQRAAKSTSAPVTVTVRNTNVSPLVSLGTPADGMVFNAPSSIALAATASDPDGTIARVEFVVDGTTIGSVTAPPYQYSWMTPPIGSHQISARAIDNRGASGQSNIARITVNGSPTVQITNPAEGAAFVSPATVSIAASANATAGVVLWIEFYDGTTLIGSVSTNGASVTASIDYAINAPGGHTFSAKAFDSAGLVGTSAARTIVVNAMPSVALRAPASGAQFGAPATIDLAADASVAFGSISKVEFFAGSTLIGTAGSSPYNVRWTNVSTGSYALTAKATTSAGLTATSATVPVSVNTVEFGVDAPADGSTLYQSDVTVTGSFNAITPNSITVNGVSAKIGNRSFAAIVPLQLGSSTLNVVAQTSLGTVTRSLNIFRQLPTLEITNVVNGQTIRDDTVTLRGRANAPPNSAVGINGRLATLAADGSFFVNDQALEPGTNAISIELITPDAAAETASSGFVEGRRVSSKSATSLNLELNRDGIAPFTLTLDKSLGFAPLTVNVQLKNRLAYVYDELELDIDGDATIDYAESGLPVPIWERQFNVTYNAPGVYPLTLTLTRQGGSEIVYRATRIVHVQSVGEAAETLRSIFIGMLQRLAAGDMAGASRWLTTTIRPRYFEAFNRLSAVLPIVVEGIGTVTDATIGEGYAELSIVRSVSDGLDHYSILMIRDGDGLWRIDGM